MKGNKVIPLRIITTGIVLLIVPYLTACAMYVGRKVISEPDEYSQTYEVKEKFVLRAIAVVFKEKSMGTNVKINEEKQIVETDFIVEDDWRTKSVARIKRLNWRECEVFLAVTTEKKTGKGWEMRRLLGKEEYMRIFDEINFRIYEEMSKFE